MLRRVTPDQVAVFVATSASFTATLSWRLSSSASANPWITVPGPQSPIQLGGSLYVLVITWTPPTSLTVDLVYEYDVQFTVASDIKVCSDAGKELPKSMRTFGLKELGLLAEPRHVGLSAGAYPSFAIQSSRAKLRLVHGSCRKPHGGGDDAMPFITELFGPNAATSALDRPHYLLLTGDQIYADDVSTSLLWLLQETGKEFIDPFTEELTLPTWLPARKVSFPRTSLEIAEESAGEKRKKLMDNFINVSSDHKESHLVFLAEFYAMYVLVWSPALWGRGWFVKWNPTSGFPSPASVARDEYNELAEAEDNSWPSEEIERHKKVRTFAQGTSKVRRVLANVSTLMMFDDHEVSDDWNLDASWNSNSRSDPMVHRIVRNALIAFAAFQAWGNDPARFATGTAGRKLLDAANPNTSTEDNVFETPDCVDGLLRLGDFKTSLSPSEKQPVLWHWAIDQAEYRILALDTRTRREYRSTQKETALLDSEAIDDQLPVEDLPSADEKVTFVLSPAPVLGHPLLEEVVQPLYKEVDARAADAEAWSLSRGSLVALLHKLSRYGRVVLLSGDVHYAYSNCTDFLTRNEGGSPSLARSARLVQLCSSALHNAEAKTRAVEQAGLVGMELRSWSGRQFPTYVDHKVDNLTLEARLRAPNEFTTFGPVKADLDVVERVVSAAVFDKTKELSLLSLVGVEVLGMLFRGLVSRNLFKKGMAVLTYAYFHALRYGVPGIPDTGIGGRYSLTLPTGPWFSDDLRKVLRQTLPLPATTDASWVWTWTTSFCVGEIESLPSTSAASSYVLGLMANKRAVIGSPNFGEVRFFAIGNGDESLRHRIYSVNFSVLGLVKVDHIVTNLSPPSVTSPWPAVY
jgi:hypothetical protein